MLTKWGLFALISDSKLNSLQTSLVYPYMRKLYPTKHMHVTKADFMTTRQTVINTKLVNIKSGLVRAHKFILSCIGNSPRQGSHKVASKLRAYVEIEEATHLF